MAVTRSEGKEVEEVKRNLGNHEALFNLVDPERVGEG